VSPVVSHHIDIKAAHELAGCCHALHFCLTRPKQGCTQTCLSQPRSWPALTAPEPTNSGWACCVQAVLSNWSQEFVKWSPDMAVVMYDGSPDERKQLQRDRVEKGTFNVLVTHYDLVMRDKSALRKV